MNPFHLPPIKESALAGFQEDKEALRRYERRFAFPCQIGFLMGFAGVISAIFIKGSQSWAIGIAIFGFGLLVFGLIIMFFSTPISSSGRPMKKYWNQSDNTEGDEVIYVCEDSKTFFRRTWAKKTRPHA